MKVNPERVDLRGAARIDMEIHTLEKFGEEQGVVEWACLDCEE